MKKPSNRKARKKPREFYLTMHEEDDPNWHINVFRTRAHAETYKQTRLNLAVKIIKVREVGRSNAKKK